ncbi:MAG TPA: TerC family protein [Catalimonadaceae bacterium]|jgi:predicted tellurium resistance membrane protein TerC|nr:TerC family protein [Catalimonadaceae bacterium]
METFFTAERMLSLLSLTLLEIVLGVDNIIFISIIAGRLPGNQQNKARQIGLILAMFVRIGLLFSISWIIGLKEDWFTLFGNGFSGRDLILLFGGLFLMGKTVSEIHEKLEGEVHHEQKGPAASFSAILVQIVLIDIVFSFDSILTAVGMSNHLDVMILAVVISLSVMMVYARRISIFINRRPTLKMLALCFLIMIGFLLVAEAFDVVVPKTTIYFGMVFALVVEMLNQRMRKKARPVKLRGMGLGKEEVSED